MRKANRRLEGREAVDAENTGFRGMYEGGELIEYIEEGDQLKVNDSYLKSTLTVTRVEDWETTGWQAQHRWVEVESPYGGRHAFQFVEADPTHEDRPDVSQFQVRPVRWRTDTEEWMNNSSRMHTLDIVTEGEFGVSCSICSLVDHGPHDTKGDAIRAKLDHIDEWRNRGDHVKDLDILNRQVSIR